MQMVLLLLSVVSLAVLCELGSVFRAGPELKALSLSCRLSPE